MHANRQTIKISNSFQHVSRDVVFALCTFWTIDGNKTDFFQHTCVCV